MRRTFGRYLDKLAVSWQARVPGRDGKPYTPWPDRSHFEFRIHGVSRAEHDELEQRIKAVIDDFIAENPHPERNIT